MDIKSANIVLDNVFNARLTDFGLSREIGKNLSRDSSIREAETSAYRPPWSADNNISTDIDIFAVGIGNYIHNVLSCLCNIPKQNIVHPHLLYLSGFAML